MFLLIYEDGRLGTKEEVDKDDLESCDDGYIQIVNMQDRTHYNEEKWVELEPFD